MSNFSGKIYPNAMRDLRESKRREAEERNARTPHDRTKAHRLGRCDCHG